jgi:hypothetical protein
VQRAGISQVRTRVSETQKQLFRYPTARRIAFISSPPPPPPPNIRPPPQPPPPLKKQDKPSSTAGMATVTDELKARNQHLQEEKNISPQNKNKNNTI